MDKEDNNSNNKNDDKNKVIPFPTKNGKNTSKKFENDRFFIIASLMSILILVALTNNKMLSNNNVAFNNNGDNSRSLASKFIDGTNEFRDLNWERRFAKKIAKNVFNEEHAALGKKPSKIDEFVFGYLKGAYNIEELEDKIQKISFNEKSQKEPKIIEDVFGFIEKHKLIWLVSYDKITKEDGYYSLMNKNNKKIGKIIVDLNEKNGLLSLVVEKIE